MQFEDKYYMQPVAANSLEMVLGKNGFVCTCPFSAPVAIRVPRGVSMSGETPEVIHPRRCSNLCPHFHSEIRDDGEMTVILTCSGTEVRRHITSPPVVSKTMKPESTPGGTA